MIRDHYFLFKLMMVSICLLLLSSQIYHSINYSVWFDDSYMANVAKSLANGDGYSAIYFDKSYAFHFGISSGPAIILPAALLIFLFGNQYFIPSIANILLIWSLLIGIFILCENFVGKEKKWPFCFLALLFAVLSSTGAYGNENPDGLVLWHLLMGDIPAALFVILGTILLFTPNISVKKIALAGLFLGLAIMSKTLAMIAVAIILFSYSLKKLCEKNPKKIQSIFIAGLCAAAPFLLFELTKLIVLGFSNYQELQIKNAEFYQHYAALTAPSENNNVTMISDVDRQITLIKRFLGVVYSWFLPVTIYIFYMAARYRNHAKSHCVWAGITLICCFAVHVYWWVNFSSGSDRYLPIATISYLVGLMLVLASLDYKALSRFQIAVIASFLFLLLASRSQEAKYLFFDGFKASNQRLEEQNEIIKSLKILQQQGVDLVSCGNNLELEFLLPQNHNFRNCIEILGKAHGHKTSNKTILVSNFLDPIQLPNRVMTENADQYYVDFKAIPVAILSKCDQEYLKTEHFSLNWCK